MHTRSAPQGAPIPGSHLGLTWNDASDVSITELLGLARACQTMDESKYGVPDAALIQLFLPAHSVCESPVSHETLAGRNRDGQLIAIGTVRVTSCDGQRLAAIRALVDPVWRGRGIGRALLAWQDARALALLELHGDGPSAIGAPIQSSMVDRRRLYAAAGFSAATRVEVITREIGDGPMDQVAGVGEAAPGWQTRAPRADEHEGIGALIQRTADTHSFLVTGLAHCELARVADASLSRVVIHEGEIRGALLVGPVEGTRDAATLAIALESDNVDVAYGFIADSLQALWASAVSRLVISLTPSAARRWAGPLAANKFHSEHSDPLYTIELP